MLYYAQTMKDSTLIALPIIIAVTAIVGAVVAGICMSAARKRERRRLEERLNNQYVKWRAAIDRAGRLQPMAVGMHLSKGEVGYLQLRTTLCETRSIRNSTHTGGAVRIAKGITVGRGYSTSESHEEWRQISTGVLYVTNKRLVFDGDMQNRVVKIDDVVSAQAGAAQVAITAASRQKTMLFDRINGQIVRDVIEMIQGGLI